VSTDAILVYDPSSYRVQQDPFPLYRRMQDEAPLYHEPGIGFWALTRFHDVLDGLADPTDEQQEGQGEAANWTSV